MDFPLEEVKKYFINKLEKENLKNLDINKNKNENEKLDNNIDDIEENIININKDNKINDALKKSINLNIIENEKLDELYNNILNLSDCFEYFLKTDILKDNNQILCDVCNKMVNAEYTTSLTTSPKILILILDRGENFLSKIKLEFDLMLDISNYIILKNQKNFNKIYKNRLIFKAKYYNIIIS